MIFSRRVRKFSKVQKINEYKIKIHSKALKFVKKCEFLKIAVESSVA